MRSVSYQNYAISSSQFVYRRFLKYGANDQNFENCEFGSTRKEVAVAYFKALLHHLPGRSDEHNDKPVRIDNITEKT
jgi:hypothetical protein